MNHRASDVRISIRCGDQPIFDQAVSPGRTTIDVAKTVEMSRLAIESDIWVPALEVNGCRRWKLRRSTGARSASTSSRWNSSRDLTCDGGKKINVIKEVRDHPARPAEAKALVEAAPKAVKEGLSKAEAEKLKAQLEAAGATVELK